MQVLQESSCTVVLCEATLSDGTWKDLIRKAEQMRPHPETIVLSRSADSALWGEVLNWGGYDLLQMPPKPQELYSTVPIAWRQRISNAEKTRKPAIELGPARELTKVS